MLSARRFRRALMRASSVRALHPGVPRAVVRFTVVVVLAVGLVVFLVVRDEVGHREPVVGGDEVDRSQRPSGRKGVRAAGDPRGHRVGQAGNAAPEIPQVVAIASIPLRPSGRKIAELVGVGPEIPRLGDQLHIAKNRVLLNRQKECGTCVKPLRGTAKCRREVESKTIDVHLLDPVAEAVHDQPAAPMEMLRSTVLPVPVQLTYRRRSAGSST